MEAVMIMADIFFHRCAILMWVASHLMPLHLTHGDTAVRIADHTPTESHKILSYESTQMGMPFQIMISVLESGQAESAQIAAQTAFSEIQRLNSIFSDYEFESELSRFSRTAGSGGGFECSQELWSILHLSKELHSASQGLFDITIGPASSLWRKARREKQFPSAKHLEMVRERVGMGYLGLLEENHSAILRREGMRLDLGGIAKGVALDAAGKILRDKGFPSHLVRAGGDMLIGDPPPMGVGWEVTLLPEMDVPMEFAPKRKAMLSNCAVGTSGDVFQHVEIEGTRYSHIVDPRSCLGLTGSRRAVVIAHSSTLADSHATIACLMDASDVPAFFQSRSSRMDFHRIGFDGKQFSSVCSTGFFDHFPDAVHVSPTE